MRHILKPNRFVKNVSWLLFGRIFQMAVQFILSVVTARYLGPSGFGTINYVASYIAFFTSFILFGLNGVIVHELVQNRDKEGDILGTAIRIRLIASIISVIIFFVVIGFAEGYDSGFFVIALLMSLQLPFTALDTIGYWYQSNLLSKYTVIIQSTAFVFVAAYEIFILATHKSITWFACSSTLNVILVSILYYYSYHKQSKQKLRFSRAIAKRMLKACLPFMLANFMVQIYAQTDKIMIRALLGSVDGVGIYSICVTISGIIGVVVGALIDSSRPIIMELKTKGDSHYVLRFTQLATTVVWLAFFYSLIITLFSSQIIHILYGDAYLSGVTCLRIVVWYTAFSYLGGLRSIWLICENKNKYVFWLSAMGALTNIVLNFLLIPRFGIEGAAFATLVTQLLANLIYPAIFKDTRPFSKLALKAISPFKLLTKGFESNGQEDRPSVSYENQEILGKQGKFNHLMQ